MPYFLFFQKMLKLEIFSLFLHEYINIILFQKHTVTRDAYKNVFKNSLICKTDNFFH